MLRRLVRSFIIGEAAVGVCLLTLLSLGTRDWIIYANVLTFAGALIMFGAAAPLVGFRMHVRGAPTRSLGVDHHALSKSQQRRENVTTIMGQVFIAIVAGGCGIGTAILFYMLQIAR